jgi:hypothetical protein
VENQKIKALEQPRYIFKEYKIEEKKSTLLSVYMCIYIGHRSVTMEGNNSPPHKKFRKQIQQVIKQKFYTPSLCYNHKSVIKSKFLTLYNVIELTYDCNKGRGCKTLVFSTCWTCFLDFL